MESLRDKLEKLAKEIGKLLDEHEAFLHYDQVREQIVIESNYTSISVPIE